MTREKGRLEVEGEGSYLRPCLPGRGGCTAHGGSVLIGGEGRCHYTPYCGQCSSRNVYSVQLLLSVPVCYTNHWSLKLPFVDLFRAQSTHRVEFIDFWHTSHRDGKISPDL